MEDVDSKRHQAVTPAVLQSQTVWSMSMDQDWKSEAKSRPWKEGEKEWLQNCSGGAIPEMIHDGLLGGWSHFEPLQCQSAVLPRDRGGLWK